MIIMISMTDSYKNPNIVYVSSRGEKIKVNSKTLPEVTRDLVSMRETNPEKMYADGNRLLKNSNGDGDFFVTLFGIFMKMEGRLESKVLCCCVRK